MSKEEIIRRILIYVSILVAVLGAVLIMMRKDPFYELIGDVVVTNGSDRVVVDGYSYSYNDDDTSKRVEGFVPLKKAKDIPEIKYFPDDENSSISVSYNKEYAGELNYSVYDSDYKPVIEDQTKLSINGEKGKSYYVEITVDWGSSKRNATVKYYFKIKIADSK